MDLSIDFSFLAQIVLFAILWFGLKKLVFDPVLEVLDERRRRTVAAQAEAERLVAAAEGARADYDRSLHEMRAQLAQESSAARNAAQEESQRALANARAAAQEEISQLRAQVSAQVDEARRGLASQAEAIAGQMLDRVAQGGHARDGSFSFAVSFCYPQLLSPPAAPSIMIRTEFLGRRCSSRRPIWRSFSTFCRVFFPCFSRRWAYPVRAMT